MRVLRRLWLAGVLLTGQFYFAFSAVLRVPDEYTTIQAALDALSEHDTVLVSPGTYVEALISPPLSFSIMGDVAADSALSNLPVVNPSDLPNSTQLACLTFTEPLAAVSIERMTFRNGRRMYPRNTGGGLVEPLTLLQMNRCLLDSTYYGVVRTNFTNDLIVLDSCVFRSNPGGCVIAEGHRVRANNCTFNGSGFGLVTAGFGSALLGCSFSGASAEYFVRLFDDSLRVENCLFSGPSPGATAWVSLIGGSGRIADNTFTNATGAHFGIYANQNCARPLAIVGNIFQHLFGVTPIVLDCFDPGDEFVRIDSNVFAQCVNNACKAIQIEPGANATVYRNRFQTLSPFEHNTIFSASPSVVSRENAFVQTGMAVRAFAYFDASFNYWGDSTGPYHPVLNPTGLGDSVSDFVDFSPWYPDTSFLVDAVYDLPELPAAFSFSVYPNPFNSTATLALEVPVAFIASIELFNTLGQQVREIHRGPVYGHETFFLNADNLPSGIYFVSVRDIVQNSVNTSQKIALIK